MTTRASTITLNAYPYEQYWSDKRDPTTNIPFKALDRAAYDAAQPKPQPKTFNTLILENEYLTLTFLPELGGRLYQVLYKPTGQTLMYNNPVLKPTPWGMPIQKGWLAAGGIEWAFPTQEHGYEWNVPWDAQITRAPDRVSVTLTDSTANDRPRVRVRVTLPAHATYFKIEPTITNPTPAPVRIQFWLNAVLNLASPKAISLETEFVFPNDAVFVHSTANAWIPREFIPRGDDLTHKAPVSFSNLNGHDLHFYKNWDKYVGVFAVESGAGKLAQNFVGAYNHETNFGVARVFPPSEAPGVKLFAFGSNFCCRTDYTDDDSGYIELWGGIARTFFPDDDVTLPAGAMRTWTEYWMPLANTNGVTAASADASVTVRVQDNVAQVWAHSAITRDVFLVLKQNGETVRVRHITLTPAQVWSEQIPIANAPVQVQLQDLNQNLIVTTAELSFSIKSPTLTQTLIAKLQSLISNLRAEISNL